MPILTRGPRDLIAMDQWFVIGKHHVASYPHIGLIPSIEPGAFTHWSLLTDEERDRCFASTGFYR